MLVTAPNNKRQYSVILLNIVLHLQFEESYKGVLHSLNFLSNSNKALKPRHIQTANQNMSDVAIIINTELNT